MTKLEFTLLDLETSGLNPAVDRVVEVAALNVAWNLETLTHVHASGGYSALVCPDEDFEMPPEASALHQLTTEELRLRGESPEKVFRDLLNYAGGRPWVSHYSRFDRDFLSAEWYRLAGEEAPRHEHLCTYRLACHLAPETMSKKLYALYYALKLYDVAERPELMPHRADDDVTALYALLEELLRRLQARRQFTDESEREILAELLALTEEPIPHKTMPAGKHRGQLLTEIPLDYLSWAVNRNAFADRGDDLLIALQREYVRRMEENFPPPLEETVLDKGGPHA